MELKEAKDILKNKGFLLENNQLDNLDDNEKIMYLYLNLKKDGYDVSKINIRHDEGYKGSFFDLNINEEITIKKFYFKVKIFKITIFSDACLISFTNPYSSGKKDICSINKDVEYFYTKLPNKMESFITVDLHDAIYEDLERLKNIFKFA